MSNFQILQPLSDDYQTIQNISAEQQNLELNYNQGIGSLKITDELHRLCLAALNGRIESTREYTLSRIDRINRNWLTYYSEKDAGNKVETSNAVSQVNGSEAFVACQDHLDDYVAIFSNWCEQLDIQDKSMNAFKYISTRLALDETDEDPKMAKLRAIYNSLSEEEKQELLNRFNTLGISDETDVFYYQKKTAILAFLKHIVEESGYAKQAQEMFLNFIVSGHLVTRDNYSQDMRSQLVRRDTGEFTVELSRNPKSRFIVVDTRNLIFGPTTDWTIEKIHLRFSELLNMCLDERGKPVPNCKYDITQIRKIADFIKKNGSSSLNEPLAGQEVNESLTNGYYDEPDYTELYNIDGNVTLYEAHNIPMQISGNVFKTVITGVVVNSDMYQSGISDLVIIGCMKSPYIDGIAHHELSMFYKKDDRAGFGVIDAIYSPYQVMNNLNRQLMDLTKPGRSGTIIVQADTDVPVKIQNIGDREVIQVKVSTRSNRSLKDLIDSWPTDYNMINTIQNMIPAIENKMKLASRKGPSGEKMAPNPSATEFSQISTELQKSVNLVAININEFLKEWVSRAYIYTVMNSLETMMLTVQMERISEDGNLTTTDKTIEIAIPDLFIDGINIKLMAYDNYQKTAIQKQQVMQVTNLLYSTGVVRNATTGQPTVFTDESGTSYIVSEYKLWNKILDMFDMDDIIQKTTTNQTQMQMNNQTTGQTGGDMGMGGGSVPTTAEVPELTANPDIQSIMNQVQLSKGVNV